MPSSSSTAFTSDFLADAYGDLRARCIELGSSLTDDQANTMSPCCPDWSVKDLFAHLGGVASDILVGNIEGAATEAWADAHVAARKDASLSEICDEWETKGAEVEGLIRQMGEAFPFKFYIDCWTHEWDIRQALGEAGAAVPDMRLPQFARGPMIEAMSEDVSSAFTLTTTVASEEPQTDVIGSGEPNGSLEVSLFEFSRIRVGRRSAAQIETLRPGYDPAELVFWAPSATDIVDPVL